MNADGSHLNRITNERRQYRQFGPSWTIDGKALVFASNRDDPKRPQIRVYKINLNGTGLERITYGDQFDGFPNFSPDGKHLVWGFHRNGKEPHETNLFIADLGSLAGGNRCVVGKNSRRRREEGTNTMLEDIKALLVARYGERWLNSINNQNGIAEDLSIFEKDITRISRKFGLVGRGMFISTETEVVARYEVVKPVTTCSTWMPCSMAGGDIAPRRTSVTYSVKLPMMR